uniref:YciI family protein n=1 Tax=Roseihalotalea indica TaxID=2867963 RepID=A0AA49GU51_9BACT|nr:YciI family protein [Tunicatimonas sp. TK19036]
MEFLLTAYDATDAEALERRMQARDEHLAYARQLKKEGKLIEGGAFLDEAGQMIGSTIIYRFASEEDLQNCIANDPYKKHGVWVDISTRLIRLANLE